MTQGLKRTMGRELAVGLAALCLAATATAANSGQESDGPYAGMPPDDSTCCRYVGDINHDGANGGVPDITDLVHQVTWMVNDGPCGTMCDDNPEPGCWDSWNADLPETDVNGDGTLIPDIGDLVYLVTFMFQGGPHPVGWIDYNTPACVREDLEWDTVYCDDGAKQNALALTVGNNGNIGNEGKGKVNLDYFDYGDCAWYDDETEDNPYLGETRVYLYDGSPVICWMEGDEVACDYSMYGRTPETGGFIPGDQPAQEYPDWMTPNNPVDADLHVALFYNRDSSIQIEQVTIAPSVDDPTYMIQAVKYTNLTDSYITGLAIGEAIDWDIPSDSGHWNTDGYEAACHLMYQVGEEYGQYTAPL